LGTNDNRFGLVPFRTSCKKGKTIVGLAPYPDDEVLGYGRPVAARAYQSLISDYITDDPHGLTFDLSAPRHILVVPESARLIGKTLVASDGKTARHTLNEIG
jgi:hypothetical protein